MSRTDTYLADYELIEAKTEDQSSRLASNEAMVGSHVTLKETADGYSYEVFSEQGSSLGYIFPKNKLAFKSAFDQAKVCLCTLSLVYYSNDKKQFLGELSYQFYTPDPDASKEAQAFSNFFNHTSRLIEEGKRPKLQISADQHEYIKEHMGEITLETSHPLPQLAKGEVVFKKQKSLADKLVQQLTHGTSSDRMKIYAALALFLILIAACVYFLFLR